MQDQKKSGGKVYTQSLGPRAKKEWGSLKGYHTLRYRACGPLARDDELGKDLSVDKGHALRIPVSALTGPSVPD
jgi:hypothetical protein